MLGSVLGAGKPGLKELGRHTICSYCGKPQWEGLGSLAKGNPDFCLEGQVKEGTPVKEMSKSRKISRSSPTRHGAKQGCQRLREDGALRDW